MSNIKEDDSILINRNKTDFKITTQDLKNYVEADDTYDDYLQEDDLLLINHDGIDYNVTLHDFKEYSLSLTPPEPEPEPMPWEGHDGGIWHITNVTAKLTLKGTNTFTAWTPDGTELGEISEVNPGEEVVFVTGKSAANLFKNSNANAKYEIGPLTNTTAVNNMKGLFQNNKKFKGVGVEYMDVSNVTTMELMFNVAEVFNGDVSGWNTSKVTNMNSMFKEAHVFNQDISGWDVSKVENMRWMFAYIDNFNQDIGGWDVSNVTNTAWMFNGSNGFNQDIGGWDVSKVVLMDGMFFACELFDQYIGGWDTSSAENMNSMFTYSVLFNQDISGWDTSSAESMNSMFNSSQAFNQDLSKWCVFNIKSEPDVGFALGAKSYVLPKPGWGTCPRGENQNRQVVTYNYTVTVNNTGYGNKYYLNGDQQQTIDALVGDTIVFDQSDSSNTGHPLRIYTDSAKTNEVTTGVTIDGSTTTFVVSEEGTFYYQCEVHSGMGSSITINN